jgi:AcrR family transcriptional regulator
MRTVDQEKQQAKRRQIVDSAARLFAERGFDGTTTDAIRRAAGMSSGNLFHYFSSKREIFAAIFADEGGDKPRLVAEAQASDDPVAALKEVVEKLAVSALQPAAPPLVMEAMLLARRDPELAELLGRADEAERAAVSALVARAAAAGRVDPALDPEDAAHWIMALVGSLFIRAAVDPRFEPAKQLPTLRLIIERFLRAER